MNELQSVVLSLAIITTAFLGSSLWLWLCRRDLLSRVGPLAFGLLVAYVALLCLPSLCWVLAFVPPWNDPQNPVFSGIGGAPFGTEVRLFPKVALALFVTTAISCGGLHLVTRFVSPRFPTALVPAGSYHVFWSNKSFEVVARVIAVVTILVGVIFFQSFGWRLLTVVHATRWEALSMDRVGLFSSFKAIMYVLFACGVISGVCCVFGFSRWLNLLAWLIACAVFLAQSSRGFTVLVITASLALLWRLGWRGRVLLACPVIVAIVVAYLMPLTTRGSDRSGVAASIAQIPAAVSGGGVIEEVRGLLFNAGIGFGLLAEVESWRESGFNAMDGLPRGYIVRMFSPLPSVVDGYARDYWHLKPRVNPYTPLSTLAEMYSWSFWLPGVYLLVVLVVLILAVRMASGMYPYSIVAILSAGIAFFYFIKMQQYDTRTVTRFVYFTLYLSIAGKLFARWFSIRSSGRRGSGCRAFRGEKASSNASRL